MITLLIFTTLYYRLPLQTTLLAHPEGGRIAVADPINWATKPPRTARTEMETMSSTRENPAFAVFRRAFEDKRRGLLRIWNACIGLEGQGH